jgi:hypothetical protein
MVFLSPSSQSKYAGILLHHVATPVFFRWWLTLQMKCIVTMQARVPNRIVVNEDNSLLLPRSLSGRLAGVSGFALLSILAISSAVPFLVRSMLGFALLAMVCLSFAALPLRLPERSDTRKMILLNVAFVALGLVVVGFSYMGIYDHFPLWPLKRGYIIRQSYLIFLWLPIGYACLAFWAWNLRSIGVFFGKYGLICCGFALVMDLATSKFLGDQRTGEWVGYVFYLDKLLLAFLFVLAAVCYVVANPKSLAFPLVMLAGFAVSHALQLGILFNAQTGTILLIVLLFSWIPLFHMINRARLVLGMICALHVILMAGLFYEKPFQDDANTLWRLHAWQDNWSMLWQTDLLGMGFGTPYHAQSAENLRNAAMNETDLLQKGAVSLSDPQYFRGQHSSFVNIFYRMGVVGGVLFVLINAIALMSCLAGIKTSSNDLDRKFCFVALMVLAMQIVQMSLHVGLETPRFLIVYLLSLTLALVAPAFTRIHNMSRFKTVSTHP